jgi:hypothetical protein
MGHPPRPSGIETLEEREGLIVALRALCFPKVDPQDMPEEHSERDLFSNRDIFATTTSLKSRGIFKRTDRKK